MDEGTNGEIKKLESAIKDLDLDYMRGWVTENEYTARMDELRSRLQALGGTLPVSTAAPRIKTEDLKSARLTSTPPEKKTLIDPVNAVKRTIQSLRKIPIERIAQESGVSAIEVTKILTDLLDGREISGRVDHESGDFILGTGTGPAPKTVHGCPYCRAEIERVAVRGETVTCDICRQSFIIS